MSSEGFRVQGLVSSGFHYSNEDWQSTLEIFVGEGFTRGLPTSAALRLGFRVYMGLGFMPQGRQ